GEVQDKKHFDVRRILPLLQVKAASWKLMIEPVLIVCDGLYAHEGQSQQNGKKKQNNQQLPLSQLRRTHCQCHRQTATDQHHGIYGAVPEFHVLAAFHPGVEVQVAIHQIAAEHAAKEHDLG